MLKLLSSDPPLSVMAPLPGIAVRENAMGRSLYSRSGHPAGEVLLEHYGRRVSFAEGQGEASDHVMEIGEDEVFLASGDLDDYVNHSCEPNCCLRFEPDGRVFLVAMRDIAPGEDLSFDYATTTTRAGIAAFPGWRFPCRCGAAGCRGEVGCAEDLPLERLHYYARHGALAPHVLRRLSPLLVLG
jgi:hypothetical protein